MNLNLIKNITLILSSFIITLIVAELFVRLFYGELIHTKFKRELYYSKNSFKTNENGIVTFEPNNTLRTIALYDNDIEYDYTFKTNNLGFRDYKNYKKDDKYGVMLIGDSFTAGSGGKEPWVYNLDKKHSDINFFNFGIAGTGHAHFYSRLKYFKSYINYDTVVVLSITNDFLRGEWYSLNTDKGTHFCYNISPQKCSEKKAIIKNLNDNNKLPIEPSSMFNMLYLTKLIKIVYNQKEINFKSNEKSRYENTKFNLNNMIKMKTLLNFENKRFIFIHIPEKDEVKRNKIHYDFKSNFKKHGIEYYSMLDYCSFDTSMYYSYDKHPNDFGYKNISNCLEKILFTEVKIKK